MTETSTSDPGAVQELWAAAGEHDRSRPASGAKDMRVMGLTSPADTDEAAAVFRKPRNSLKG
jgi:hypothetical protein